MKRWFLAIMIILLTGSIAIAQKKDLTEEQWIQIDTKIDAYLANLDLSDDKKPRFEEITKRYGKQLLELRESDKGKLSKYNAFRSIQKKKNAEMKHLLSDEQYKTYLEIQEEQQQKMRERQRDQR